VSDRPEIWQLLDKLQMDLRDEGMSLVEIETAVKELVPPNHPVRIHAADALRRQRAMTAKVVALRSRVAALNLEGPASRRERCPECELPQPYHVNGCTRAATEGRAA